MGIKDFVKLKETNPLSSYQRTVNAGGSDMDALKAIADPQALILKQPKNALPGEIARAEAKKKKKKKRMGMKAGGKVKSTHQSCRGMGCATHGGRFGKDG